MPRPRTAAIAIGFMSFLSLSAAARPTPLSAWTATPSLRLPAAHLAERQILCDIFGGCDTTSTSDAASAAQASDSSTGTTSNGAADATLSTSASMTDTDSVAQADTTSSSSAATITTTQVTSTSSTSASSETSTTSITSSSASSTISSLSSSTASTASEVIVTITSVVTGADGSESTMTQETASAVPIATKQNSSSGPSGKTWGIIGGVAGGVLLLVALLYVAYRLTQRRFSNLDSSADDIRWPELQPDGENLVTLNPQGTRRTGGAGFAMEKDRDEDEDEDNDDELDRKGGAGAGIGSEWAVDGTPRLGAGPGLGPRYGYGHNQSEAAFFEGQGGVSPYDVAYGELAPGPQQQADNTYYDPFLPQGETSDPAQMPLAQARAVAGDAPYSGAGNPVYPPVYANYADAPYSDALYGTGHRSTDELAVPFRAASPRAHGY